MGAGVGSVKGRPFDAAKNGKGSAPQDRTRVLGAGSGSPHPRSFGEGATRKPSQVSLNGIPAKPARKAEASDQRSSCRIKWERKILLANTIVLLARNMKNGRSLRSLMDPEARQKSTLEGEPGSCHRYAHE